MNQISYSQSLHDLNSNANSVKQQFILAMEKEGVINKDTADIMMDYVMILKPKGFFGRLVDKIFKSSTEDNSIDVMVAKIINLNEEDEVGK